MWKYTHVYMYLYVLMGLSGKGQRMHEGPGLELGKYCMGAITLIWVRRWVGLIRGNLDFPWSANLIEAGHQKECKAKCLGPCAKGLGF